jgi:hypothetical protein
MIIAPARHHFSAPIARRSVPTLLTLRAGAAFPTVAAPPIAPLSPLCARQPNTPQPQSSALPHDCRLTAHFRTRR